MGTYQPEYKIKQILIKPDDKIIFVTYDLVATLDTGQELVATNTINVENTQFDAIFNSLVTACGKTATLQEFFSYLVACAGKLQDDNFPISSELAGKFGTMGQDLFSSTSEIIGETPNELRSIAAPL